MIHTFNLSVPKDWQSLSDSQLQYFFTQLSHDLPMEEILTLCLFKWVDLRVLYKTHDGCYLVKRRRKQEQEATLTIRQVQAATASLDFLRQFAPLPVRITKIGRATAIEADVQVFWRHSGLCTPHRRGATDCYECTDPCVYRRRTSQKKMPSMIYHKGIQN